MQDSVISDYAVDAAEARPRVRTKIEANKSCAMFSSPNLHCKHALTAHLRPGIFFNVAERLAPQLLCIALNTSRII
jgi:hypothetical protein